MISPEMTSELKEILFQEFGKDVSLAEAGKIGNALVSYNSLLTKMNKTNEARGNNE